VRASAGISTTSSDLERLFEAVDAVARTAPPVADPVSGDYWPQGFARPDAALGPLTGCTRG
jgi:hypothetical protein